MRKLLLLGLGMCAIGAFYREQDDDHESWEGSMAPFMAALALEVGIFLLRRKQGSLLARPATAD